VERKASGREHGAMTDAGEFDADLERLDPLLATAREASPLPAEASNVAAVDAFLVRMRKERFE
jgi:hypothetical protein